MSQRKQQQQHKHRCPCCGQEVRCRMNGCTEEVHARGFCRRHYDQSRYEQKVLDA